MECLTPPVEFVPLDEWYCPTCGSREDAEEEEERAFTDSGEHSSAGTSVCEDAEDVMAPSLLRASRGRPRGRPRGSTARRFAISERPGCVFFFLSKMTHLCLLVFPMDITLDHLLISHDFVVSDHPPWSSIRTRNLQQGHDFYSTPINRST